MIASAPAPVVFGDFAIYLGAEILISLALALALALMPRHGGVGGLVHAAYLVIASYGLAILLTT